MKLGIVGLGRMGGNMALRLMAAGHECVVSDLNAANVEKLSKQGAKGVSSLDDLVKRLEAPRVIWVMVPAGEPTDQAMTALASRLSPGDILIDGGNSHYKDDIRRAKWLAERKIRYLDAGVSGGIWGRERGYCLMVGGDESAAKHCEPVFKALAPGRGEIAPVERDKSLPKTTASDGYLYCGPSGSGHYVKMVHNGIEYGMMQALAEGFELLEELPDYELDLGAVAELWRRGSVVSSWLLDLVARSLNHDPGLRDFSGRVADSGEGRWMLESALETAVPLPALASALFTRFRSRQTESYGEKLLSAMRHEFGGHVEPS